MHAGVNDPLAWRIMSSNITVSRREWRLVKELINSCCIIMCMNYIVFITSCRQLSTYWMNREILSKSDVVSLIFTIRCSFKKGLWLVDSIILAIGLCQIHMQAVDYILDDQMINSEHV